MINDCVFDAVNGYDYVPFIRGWQVSVFVCVSVDKDRCVMGCWIKSFALSLLALGCLLRLLLGDLLGLLLRNLLSLRGRSNRRRSLQCLSHGPSFGRLLLMFKASRGSGDCLIDG